MEAIQWASGNGKDRGIEKWENANKRGFPEKNEAAGKSNFYFI